MGEPEYKKTNYGIEDWYYGVKYNSSSGKYYSQYVIAFDTKNGRVMVKNTVGEFTK